MLVNEVEIEEAVNVARGGNVADGVSVIGIAEAGKDMPGSRNSEEEQEASEEAHLAPAAPLAGEDEIGNDGCGKKDGRDEPFREHCDGQRSIRDVKAGGLAIFKAGEEAVESESDEEGEKGLGDEKARPEKDADRGENSQRGVKCGAVTIGAPRPEPCKNGAGQDAERHGQMRGKDVLAEDAVIDGGQPIGERRLLKIADAVDIESDPVSAGDDVLGSLRVSGIGIIEQRGRKQRYKMNGEKNQCKQRPGADGRAIDRPGVQSGFGRGVQFVGTHERFFDLKPEYQRDCASRDTRHRGTILGGHFLRSLDEVFS